jgi:membrane protein required for colicin V production
MTVFDYAVLAVLAASLLLGLWRGFVSEVLALAAWVAAFFAARAVAPGVAPIFARFTHEAALQYVGAFALVFIGVLLVFAIGRTLVSKLLHAAGLGWADRLLGTVFGIARGLIIVLLAVLVGGMTALPRQPWWRDAQLAPPLETAVVAAKPWMPTAVAKRIRYR